MRPRHRMTPSTTTTRGRRIDPRIRAVDAPPPKSNRKILDRDAFAPEVKMHMGINRERTHTSQEKRCLPYHASISSNNLCAKRRRGERHTYGVHGTCASWGEAVQGGDEEGLLRVVLDGDIGVGGERELKHLG